MDKELVKKLKNDSYFEQFQEFVISQIDKLNSIDDLKNLSSLEAGETVKARAIASSMLQEILKPFIDFTEKREPTEKEIKAAKARAGL